MVSKHIPIAVVDAPHDVSRSVTAAAAALPVPDGSFGTPRSFVETLSIRFVSSIARRQKRGWMITIPQYQEGAFHPSAPLT